MSHRNRTPIRPHDLHGSSVDSMVDDGLLEQCPVCKAPRSRDFEIGSVLAENVLELSWINVHRIRCSADYFLTPSAHTRCAAATALPGSIGWPISFSTSSKPDRAARMSNWSMCPM